MNASRRSTPQFILSESVLFVTTVGNIHPPSAGGVTLEKKLKRSSDENLDGWSQRDERSIQRRDETERKQTTRSPHSTW